MSYYDHGVRDLPPGFLRIIPSPPGLIRAYDEAEVRFLAASDALREWHVEMDEMRSAAWVEWHDANGWPAGEPDYRARARHGVTARGRAKLAAWRAANAPTNPDPFSIAGARGDFSVPKIDAPEHST